MSCRGRLVEYLEIEPREPAGTLLGSGGIYERLLEYVNFFDLPSTIITEKHIDVALRDFVLKKCPETNSTTNILNHANTLCLSSPFKVAQGIS